LNNILKILGYLMKNPELDHQPLLLMTSSRIHSELLKIILKSGIKNIITRATVTYQAIELAKQNQNCLIGFVKNDRYTKFC
ncbi:MAG: formate dehydrogenase accessory sulfurtransferase FdhD, partial [Spirochaetes bacterium]|nr:formate dehydrogenase accessory sulfurtransferase FdhD [Spirochaetota bacterium]